MHGCYILIHQWTADSFESREELDNALTTERNKTSLEGHFYVSPLYV